MIVRDIMTPVLEVIRGCEYLDQAVQTMNRLGMNCLPVIDNCQVVGIITDEDIFLVSAVKGLDPTKTQVRNVMMGGEMRCSENQTIQEMVRLLEQMNKKYLVVLNSHGRAVGIVSRENMAYAQ